jgi:hypothetical protein
LAPRASSACRDNIFASYILGLDAPDLAYSNLIQVIKSKSAAGFVPNFAAGLSRSDDRTEPPIGAKVLLELYKKWQDEWVIELLFDDLLDWSNWFVQRRLLPPARLVALGSTGGMHAARLESGLDDSVRPRHAAPSVRPHCIRVLTDRSQPLVHGWFWLGAADVRRQLLGQVDRADAAL